VDGSDTSLVIVNLDPFNMQHGFVQLPLADWGFGPTTPSNCATCSRPSATSGAASGTTSASTRSQRSPTCSTSCTYNPAPPCRAPETASSSNVRLSLVQRRRHLPGPRPGLLRQQQRRRRRLRRADAEARLPRGLGVNCIWLLPFYPSPLRDDGYDIADYENIHPSYGTLQDFDTFIAEAHRRGLRVITELVINHTSDQHPWFQAARRAPAGSPERDFYVWSDTNQKYQGVRIIFTDSEISNWTWDETAKAYYWHRFFHHQPDLNFDNPAVLDAVIKVMLFWLDRGVDGLRLDAVPYLIEREGTICENLEETHDVLKKMRRALDERYPDRMLLAEANQWPADVRPYFGDGDECHMAFHFPLMPRMFMAVRQENRHPIVEILRQTPDIPENCQWAMFLRNHDELTLEMVTDEERDYMFQSYAADPLMRINVGIRRRLAPLLENSRRRIELLNSLLFSMPGTPIIYYGDELGHGRQHLPGRPERRPHADAVDRRPQRRVLARGPGPAVLPRHHGRRLRLPVHQRRSAGTLALLAAELDEADDRPAQAEPVFGRGSIEFLPAENRKVLATCAATRTRSSLRRQPLARRPAGRAGPLDFAA
jgi:maltose alpha-D-glucosyltransferase / alpha-amylase